MICDDQYLIGNLEQISNHSQSKKKFIWLFVFIVQHKAQTKKLKGKLFQDSVKKPQGSLSFFCIRWNLRRVWGSFRSVNIIFQLTYVEITYSQQKGQKETFLFVFIRAVCTKTLQSPKHHLNDNIPNFWAPFGTNW